MSAYGFEDFFNSNPAIRADPARIAAQIVAGVGFLGAGAIFRQGAFVRGLTTAATLWAVAAIGLAAGAGYYSASVATTVLVLVSLWPLKTLMRRFRQDPEDCEVFSTVPAGVRIDELLNAVRALGVAADAISLREPDREATGIKLVVTLPSRRVELIASVRALLVRSGASCNPDTDQPQEATS